MARMSVAPLFFSSTGRLTPSAFAIAVSIVYVVSFLSQMLQFALVWSWVVLHVKRLRDAGRSAGMAFGIACLYGLTVVLVLLVVAMVSSTEASSETMRTGQGLIQLFIVIYLFAMLVQSQELGSLAFWLMGFVVILLLPVLIGFAYSVWAATRPGQPKAAAAAPAVP
jgi:uncharacterized membrane protein YhaH (DUF805 family)